MAKKRPTLADVALKSGVSKMTASRALRSSQGVSKQSYECVQKAARALGYVGNPLATSLSNRASDLIGVIVPSMTNAVFPEVLSGIAEEIQGTGLQPVFGVTEYDPEREYQIIRQMLSWRPAGLIVTGLDQPEETRALLRDADIPIVQIMDLDGDPVDCCVGISNFDAGKTMAEALLERGFRAFGYVGAVDVRARKRLDGFRYALAEHGLEFVSEKTTDAASSMVLGRRLTEEILLESPTLDCLYFSNDDMAAGGGFACMAQGISIPDAVAIVGFNGLEFVQALPCRMATSVSPRRGIGNRAAALIIARLGEKERPPAETIRLTPRIDLGAILRKE
ncbi:LacI family DNA-binding transcriptional regulator [Falsihalocynthiibacter sp. S25ZX9]|uniref:LacI family DNA-binding transcriptional regulator n=1 Tax=Falsihalocynthiibacter sp. S25ZX9 TaxID=3240870 RepID=UPI0035109BFD